MNICGIVCEFNPFHTGHRFLIDECRRVFGADTGIVCAMSGDVVQRGEAAAFTKHDRAAAAVAGGADLVLELPLPWSMAPAETFARGGVGLLAAAGCVTHLCFGSESGDPAALEEAAELLLRPELDELLRRELETGIPYAAARQRALEALSGKPAPALSRPNDILAVEYLKALRQQGAALTPFAVPRRGAAHDAAEAGETVSSSLLRQKLRAGEPAAPWIPAAALAALEAGDGPVNAEAVELAILSRLRCAADEAFACAPDVSEGLDRRVFRAARTEPTLASVAEAASTKRYPKARVRRIALSAALGLRAEDSAGLPPYLRPLAANERGLAMLREMERGAALPVVTKPARVHALGGRAERSFALGAAAADLCTLGLAEPEARRGDRDWRSAPRIVRQNPDRVCNMDAIML